MKKTESKFALLAALIAILAFASIPLWQNNLNSLRPQTHTVKKKKTAKSANLLSVFFIKIAHLAFRQAYVH